MLFESHNFVDTGGKYCTIELESTTYVHDCKPERYPTKVTINGVIRDRNPQINVSFSVQILIMDPRNKECKVVEFYNIRMNTRTTTNRYEDVKKKLQNLPDGILVAIVTNNKYILDSVLNDELKENLGIIDNQIQYVKVLASVSITGYPQRTKITMHNEYQKALFLYHTVCLGGFIDFSLQYNVYNFLQFNKWFGSQ